MASKANHYSDKNLLIVNTLFSELKAHILEWSRVEPVQLSSKESVFYISANIYLLDRNRKYFE